MDQSKRQLKSVEVLKKYKRGSVWWVELPLNLFTHIQGGTRPCVIVSNPLERSGVVTVCPLSTKIDDFKTHPKIKLKKEGQILVEQITTVDISSIKDNLGQLSNTEIKVLNKVMKAYLLSDDYKQDTPNEDDEPEPDSNITINININMENKK